jgi:hypothetical protein
VASINSNQDNISQTVCQKYIELNANKDDLCTDYILIHLDCIQSPTILTLIQLNVRKNTVLFSLAAVVLNFVFAILDYAKKVK